MIRISGAAAGQTSAIHASVIALATDPSLPTASLWPSSPAQSVISRRLTTDQPLAACSITVCSSAPCWIAAQCARAFPNPTSVSPVASASTASSDWAKNVGTTL